MDNDFSPQPENALTVSNISKYVYSCVFTASKIKPKTTLIWVTCLSVHAELCSQWPHWHTSWGWDSLWNSWRDPPELDGCWEDQLAPSTGVWKVSEGRVTVDVEHDLDIWGTWPHSWHSLFSSDFAECCLLIHCILIHTVFMGTLQE